MLTKVFQNPGWKLGLVVCTYNPSTQEAEIGKTKFEASLGLSIYQVLASKQTIQARNNYHVFWSPPLRLLLDIWTAHNSTRAVMFSEYIVHTSLTSVISIQSRIALWAYNWTSMLLCGVSWWHRTRYFYLGSFTSHLLFFLEELARSHPFTDLGCLYWPQICCVGKGDPEILNFLSPVLRVPSVDHTCLFGLPLSGHGYPGTHYAHQLSLNSRDSPASASRMLELKEYITMPHFMQWSMEPWASCKVLYQLSHL